MAIKGREMGRQRMDFTTADGTRICGTKLHWAFEEDGVDGEAVEAVFLRDDVPLPPGKPGQAIAVEYNRKGRVVSVSAVTGKQLNLSTQQ